MITHYTWTKLMLHRLTSRGKFFCCSQKPVQPDKSPRQKPKLSRRRVTHGMLYSSLIGTIFGSSIAGAVYMNQTFQFRRPVFVGDAVTARIVVTRAALSPKHMITCRYAITYDDAYRAQLYFLAGGSKHSLGQSPSSSTYASAALWCLAQTRALPEA